MENRYGLLRQGSGVWRSLTDGDFEEEDVWAVLKERRDSSSKVGQSIIDMETPISVQRRLPSAARMIPRTNNGSSSSSSNSPSHERSKGVKLQSAPVKIPDWSKVSGKKSRKASKNDDDDDRFFNHGRDSYYDDDDDDYDDDDGGDDDDDVYNCKVPIHEFIDSRQARSQISSFSVFEGVGRTLKGRDLSKVRNAVLTKTGFLE